MLKENQSSFRQMCRSTCIEPSKGFSSVGMERMTQFEMRALRKARSSRSKTNLVFRLEGFRRLNTFKAHSDKRQLKALLNRNCFFCLSELAQVPKSPPPPVSSFHPWAGDSQAARAQCRSCATTAAAPLPRNRPGSGGCPLPPGGPDGCAPRTGRWPRFREM